MKYWLLVLLSSMALGDEEQRPLYELGLGLGGGIIADYPGSDQAHFQWAAFPLFFYHGEILRVDRRDGAHARVIHKPRVGIDMTGAGYFPVDSNENRAREGMKSLGWLGEIGPRLYYRIFEDDGRLWRAFLLARGAVSAKGWDLQQRGAIFGIGTGYDHKRIWGPDFSIYTKITAYWATEEYNDYFYTINPEYATADRPAYKGRAGYLGTWYQMGASYEYSHWAISGGVGLTSCDGSANDGSPLLKEDLNWSFYFGVAWFLYKSDVPGKM